MLAAIHQPAYLPWRPYLDKIALADVFVLLDTVPFTKGEFINRNFIATANGPLLLSIPVVHNQSEPLAATRIDQRSDWSRKHLESIRQAYSRAPRFAEVYADLAPRYDHDRLIELCVDQLRLWLAELNIETPIVRASTLREFGTKSERLISLCRSIGADAYISGDGGRDYLDAGAFERAGIELVWQEHAAPPAKLAALDGIMAGLA